MECGEVGKFSGLSRASSRRCVRTVLSSSARSGRAKPEQAAAADFLRDSSWAAFMGGAGLS